VDEYFSEFEMEFLEIFNHYSFYGKKRPVYFTRRARLLVVTESNNF